MSDRDRNAGDAGSQLRPATRPPPVARAPEPGRTAGVGLSPDALARQPVEQRAAVLASLSRSAGNAAISRRLATLARGVEGPLPGAAAPVPAVEPTANAPPLLSEPIEVEFDRFRPWLFEAVGPLTEEAIVRGLYGADSVQPLEGEQVLRLSSGSFLPRLENRWVAVPHRLLEPYRTQYLDAMAARRADLDEILDRDLETIEAQLERPWFERAEAGQCVVDIFLRWAAEPYPGPQAPGVGRPRWGNVDRLISRLRRETREIGVIADQWTTLYDMIFNRLDVGSELRRIQDEHALSHVGMRPEPEMDVFGMGKEDLGGMFWEDVKSGEVASRIGNYFAGMAEAGIALADGVRLLLADPGRALEGIANLPDTVSMVWKHRDRLWSEFVNADSDEQARMIGRLFGEAELLIATVGAGGGAARAAAAPELATAEAVQLGRGGAAAALGGGEAITIDLAQLGGESARLTVLMAETTKAGGAAQEQADKLDDSKGGEVFDELADEMDLPPADKPAAPGLDPSRAEQLLKEARAFDSGESLAGNYRLNFAELHPDFPGGKQWQVHHAIPQKFRKLLADAGVRIDHPAFLRGVRTTPGQKSNVHAKITDAWRSWHKKFAAAAGREPTAAEVIEYAKEIDWRFGGNYWEAEKAAGLPVPRLPAPPAP